MGGSLSCSFGEDKAIHDSLLPPSGLTVYLQACKLQQQTSYFRACGLLLELGAGQDTTGELNDLLKIPAEAWASALPHS